MIEITKIANDAISAIIEEEGGWVYTDHPKDIGKGTYAGIRYQTFLAYYIANKLGPKMSPSLFKTLAEANTSQSVIIKIYYTEFYAKLNIPYVPSNLEAALLSSGVNLGVRRAIMIMQKTINKIAGETILYDNDEAVVELIVDGLFGRKTTKAINNVYYKPLFVDFGYTETIEIEAKIAAQLRAKTFLNLFIRNWCRRYVNVVVDAPDNLIWLNGWFNRAEKYWVL